MIKQARLWVRLAWGLSVAAFGVAWLVLLFTTGINDMPVGLLPAWYWPWLALLVVVMCATQFILGARPFFADRQGKRVSIQLMVTLVALLVLALGFALTDWTGGLVFVFAFLGTQIVLTAIWWFQRPS